MPGIVGIIEKAKLADAPAQLKGMVKSMLHENFYTSGSWSSPALRTHLGWICHPHSFSDCLPIWNETKSICLIFSGENFFDRSKTEMLRDNGHSFNPLTASSLVHLYEEFGVSFLAQLNGSFSGVVVDLRENKAILFNDRYGLNRIYFHENEEAFYFASEAKALLKVLPELRAINTQALADFFSCGFPLENRTLFSGIHLAPGATEWTWRPFQGITRCTYFDRSAWENQVVLPSEAFYERLKEVFTRVVPRYFEGSQPVAMSLTGGLDSRMIMAAIRPEAASLKCYTFGGIYRESTDVKIAKLIAQATEQPFETLRLSSDFFSSFPSLAVQTVYKTDGAMDVAGAANLYFNRLARRISPVRMTGNYGGEILRGIVCLKPSSWDEQVFAPEFIPHLRTAAATIASARKAPLSSFIAFKQVPWLHYAMLAIEQSQVTVRTPYLDNELIALSYQAGPEFRRNKNAAFRYVADLEPRLAVLPNDRGAIWKPDADLNQSRSAFRYLREEFLPKAEYLFDYGMPGWFAPIDRLLSPLRLDRLFLGNQKFCHYRSWYRRELSSFVREVLLDERTLSRPFLNRRRIEQIVSSHVRGTANHTFYIHKLLTCELLHRTLIEQN